MINIRGLLLLLVVLVNSTLVEDMDEDIGEAIFHENQLYLVYVYRQISEQYFVPFRQYCNLPHTLCTTMNPKVEQYNQFIDFIGANRPQFFLIVDAESRKKYIMSEEKQITVSNLAEFVEGYKAGSLEAFVSSEDIPKQDSPFVTHLVGKTIYDFIHKNPESFKVVLFTTDIEEICENCPQILIDFKELAQKMKGSQRQFGYMDLVKNQHPQVKQQVVPLIAVYKQGIQVHAFKKFYVGDLEEKIYALERGETLPEDEEQDDDVEYNRNDQIPQRDHRIEQNIQDGQL